MFKQSQAFSSFAVSDIQQAEEFYGNILGLEVSKVPHMRGLLELHLHNNTRVMVYAKPDHTPATFTVLNFPVDTIETAVEELKQRGVHFETYNTETINTDEQGISRGEGPRVAWFRDPSGNILSVLEEK